MSGFHKRRKRFKFTEKKHSKRGIAATIVASISIIVYIVILVMAYHSKGNLSVYYGCVGVLAFGFSLVNLIPAIKGIREENSFQLFPRLGFLLTVIAIVFWIGAYFHGMA